MQRWSPEKDDEANKGLSIIRDLLLPVKQATSSSYSPLLSATPGSESARTNTDVAMLAKFAAIRVGFFDSTNILA